MFRSRQPVLSHVHANMTISRPSLRISIGCLLRSGYNSKFSYKLIKPWMEWHRPIWRKIISRCEPKRTVRSSSAYLLKQESFKLLYHGIRTFAISAPQLWNSMPIDIKCSANINIFKLKVKTHLLKLAFGLS